MNNIITAVFGASREVKTNPVWRIDKGMQLRITGLDLPDYYQVHFANQPVQGEAIPVLVSGDIVDIPDQYFQTGEDIYAWIYLTPAEGVGYTIRRVTIPVKARPDISGDEPTPEQESIIDQAIAALNTGVEAAESAAQAAQAAARNVPQIIDAALQEAKDSGEFDGPPGPRGESGATGPQGPAGVGVPAGGSTGQVLAKRSGTDYDTEWVNQSGGGGGGAVDDVKVNGNTVVTDGVANVPLADTINPGVVRIPSGTNASIDIHNGTISVRTATPDAIKYGTNDLPIGANVAKETAFYGLASAAGDTSQKQSVNPVGTYTANAKQAIKTMLGITDVTSYNTLNDKPSINGVTLSGNKTLSNLGAASAADVAAKYTKPSDGIPKSDLASSVQTSLGKADTALQTAPVASVAGRTGAVTLDAGDVEYDDTDTYSAGTVGAGIADLKSEKADVDLALGAYPTDTVSGAVTSFSDGGDNLPVKDLTIAIEPVQSGSGDPSPDNVRPISGWTGANINANGTTIPITFPTEAGTVYGGTLDVTTGVLTVDKACVEFDGSSDETIYSELNGQRAKIPNGAPGVEATSGRISVMCNIGTTTSGSDPNTVFANANGSIYYYFPTSPMTVEQFRTLLANTPMQVVYKIATPVPIQLTPAEVRTLLGNNTIYADCGDVSITYRADSTLLHKVSSVAGKYGAVTLDAGDMAFSEQEVYNPGTVGKEVGDLKSEIGDLANLTTTAKNNLVAAINEAAQSGGGSVDLYYVTPEQYGAVGDGVTDDSQAVQDACDAGYAVYFDSGKTYYLASTVTIDHDCHLFGGEGATIKTKTPTGGTAPNGIVVTGTLKKTTTLTSDYASTGTGDNGGNQWTLTDMTGIEIGDILIVKATDQYYNYSRAYYYLGATLLIGDIYNGHLYTTDSMPWDITNTANVTVQVYSAPTAIIEGLNFVSDLDSLGNYIYCLTLERCKNSVVRNCNLTQMDNGLMILNCVNTLVDSISVSKSKYDNELSGDGYGIGIYSSSETIIERVEAICAQTCITLSGTTPNINTHIRNCNLASECRANAVGSHENSYNVVVEDCVLTSLNVLGTATVNRCRFVKNNRISGNATGISFCGSHNPDWATLKVQNCVFEGLDARIYLTASSVQSPIQAFDNIIGLVEITNCDGARLIYNGLSNEYILSNRIVALHLRNWTNCYEIYHPNADDIIEYMSVVDCSFVHIYWINDHNDAHGIALTNVYNLDFCSTFPMQHKRVVNKNTRGDKYTLPKDVSINLASNNNTAKFIVCGKNLASDDINDYIVGYIGGNAGGDLSRTATTTSNDPILTSDTNGNIVFNQRGSLNNRSFFPVGLFCVNERGTIKMSATIKNTGDTSGASFKPFIAIVNSMTGKLIDRYTTSAVTATIDGAEINYSYPVCANCVAMCYYYCSSVVANSETTFEDMRVVVEDAFAPSTLESIPPYEARRRTGDGSILSLDGVNNIMCSELDFHIRFAADYIDNPIGLLPSASGVSF